MSRFLKHKVQNMSVGKSTVYRLMVRLVKRVTDLITCLEKRIHSGTVVIDEKWVKIKELGEEKWAYVFIAVDAVINDIMHMSLKLSNSYEACKSFLLELKAKGYSTFRSITTDGLTGWARAIADEFSKAKHHLCVRHGIKDFKDLLNDIYRSQGRDYRKSKTAKRLLKEIVGILNCKRKETSRKRYNHLMSRLFVRLFELGYRLKPLNQESMNRVKLKTPLEIAGYKVEYKDVEDYLLKVA
ncbi:MAG: transposase [bacterium]|nr:transposase [bacterium]